MGHNFGHFPNNFYRAFRPWPSPKWRQQAISHIHSRYPFRIRRLSCSRSRSCSPSISSAFGTCMAKAIEPKRSPATAQKDGRPFFPFATFFCLLLLPLFSFFFFFAVHWVSVEGSRALGLSGSRTLGLGFGFSCEFEFEVQVQSLGPSVVRSILITLIKVLPSLVFFTPFLTNYAGISCFRFCSSRRRRRVRWSLCSLEPLLIVVL